MGPGWTRDYFCFFVFPPWLFPDSGGIARDPAVGGDGDGDGVVNQKVRQAWDRADLMEPFYPRVDLSPRCAFTWHLHEQDAQARHMSARYPSRRYRRQSNAGAKEPRWTR